MAEAVLLLIKGEIKKHPLALFGRYMLKGAFKSLKSKTDPVEYGGAPLLGINGVVLIAHGGSSALAVKNALRAAGQLVTHGINRKITEKLQQLPSSMMTLKVTA